MLVFTYGSVAGPDSIQSHLVKTSQKSVDGSNGFSMTLYTVLNILQLLQGFTLQFLILY